MDDGQFDTLVRVLGSGTPRRRVLAGLLTGLLTGLPLALGGQDLTAKKKGKKKKGNKKKKPPCPRERNCAGRECGSDGCGGECGTCENGSCVSGQCLCPFPVVRTPPCNPGSCPTCSPGFCCATNQTCLNGACNACPEAPDPCNLQQEHFCGSTTAQSPFCFCVTSVDDDTTCSSIFVNPSQSAPCDSDDDCTGILGFGVDTVCVHAPCVGLGIDKVCMNKGCVNLSASRGAARSESNTPTIRQASLRAGR